MSAYCDPPDIQKVGISAEYLNGFDSDRLTDTISMVSGTMDSYLSKKFTLPIVSWGQDLRRCAAIMAAYDLASGEGYNPEDPGDSNLRARYKDMLAWLEMVSAGDVVPVDLVDSTPGGEEAVSSFAGIVSSSSQRGWSSRGSGGSAGPFEGD